MAEQTKSRDSRLIETEAIIVAYAMSRLDELFLVRFRFKSWCSAFAATGSALGVPAASMKNLRDEFDPLHGFRKGWHQRPIRPNRQRVLSEFCEVSDDALLEIADRLLARDRQAAAEIAAPLAFSKERVENVAERLRTGRLAEEYFLSHSQSICGVPKQAIRDCRQDASGFDFAVVSMPQVAIEVKGLKSRSGGVLFTDLEWRTARTRSSNYWLVVVGDILNEPQPKLWRDPSRHLEVRSSVRRSTAVSWHANVSVA